MKTVIRIDTPQGLQRAIKYCHDAKFKTSSIIFNRSKNTYSLRIFRPLLNRIILERKVSIFKVWAVPRIEAVLSFSHVINAEIISDFLDDIILTIKYDEGRNRLVFNCAQGTLIILSIDRLEGKLIDVGKQFFDGAKVVTFWNKVIVRHNM